MFKKLSVCLSVCLTSSAFADYTGWYDESGAWAAAEKSGLIEPGDYTYRTYDFLTYELRGVLYVDDTDVAIRRADNGLQLHPTQMTSNGFLRKYAFDASGIFGWDWGDSTWIQMAAIDSSDFFENLLLANLEQKTFFSVISQGEIRENGLALIGWNETGFEIYNESRSFKFAVGYYAEGETYTVGSETPATPEPATMLIFGLGIAGAGLMYRRKWKTQENIN
jgi:hypothetical protein